MGAVGPYVDVGSSAAACFLSLVFLRALLHKLGGYAEFVGSVRDYRLMPDAWVPVAAASSVVLEAIAALGLIAPYTRGVATLLAAGLLALYAVAMAINLARGRTAIDCGCGGGGQGISRLHVIRNGVLVLFAVPVFAHAGPAPSGLVVSLAATGCVVVLWVIFLVFDQLLSNRMHAIATAYSSL